MGVNKVVDNWYENMSIQEMCNFILNGIISPPINCRCSIIKIVPIFNSNPEYIQEYAEWVWQEIVIGKKSREK